ncbi:MAG: sugar ABC transporter permease [Spirochaetaceae bacterium]|jgi:ABC-type sugar transport system permease subunit|nr:sugar ABC transporter permease [Spirochaetaceae bacterium]
MSIREKSSSAARDKKDSLQAVLLVLPGAAGFIIFTYFPIVYILRYALYNYNGFNLQFTGLENFVRLFSRDPEFWHSIGNTFILAFGKLAVEIPLALALAVLLNRKLIGTAFFRVAYFLPAIISTAIVGLIFSLMFATFDGVVNGILIDLHIIKQNINWFGFKWTAMLVLAIASIWQNVGVNMIFFMVALQGIPKELYECASIDGVSSWRQFWSITLPMIGPMFQMILLMAIIGSLKVADLILASTNGQPGGSTEVVMTYVFKYFFGYSGRTPQIGYASAMAVVTGVILAVVSVIYLKATKSMKEAV